MSPSESTLIPQTESSNYSITASLAHGGHFMEMSGRADQIFIRDTCGGETRRLAAREDAADADVTRVCGRGGHA